MHRNGPVTARRRSEGSIDLESLSFALDPYGRPVLSNENDVRERKRSAAARRRMTSRMRGYLSEDDDHHLLLNADKAARVRAEIARRRELLLNSELENRLAAREAALEMEESRLYHNHQQQLANAHRLSGIGGSSALSPTSAALAAAYYGTDLAHSGGFFTDELLDYRDIDPEDAYVYESHLLPHLTTGLSHHTGYLDPRINSRGLAGSRLARFAPGYLSRSLDAAFDDYYGDLEYLEHDPRFIADPALAAYLQPAMSK